MSVRDRFKQKLQESRGQLDELHGKGKLGAMVDTYERKAEKAEENSRTKRGRDIGGDVDRENVNRAKARRAYSLLQKIHDKKEEQVDEVWDQIATGLGIGAVGAAVGAGVPMLLHGKYGKKRKSVADRLYDTKQEKKLQKYKIDKANTYIKQSKKPKSIDKWTKEKADAETKLKNTSYLKSLLPEEQLDELRRPRDPDKGRKYISGGARAAEDAAAKKYYDKYDDETAKRRKAIKSKSEEDKKAATKAGEERQKAAKRVIKLQKIKEENINEISAAAKADYQEKANDSFKKSFGKKDPKSVKTVGKRLTGLRLSLRKKTK